MAHAQLRWHRTAIATAGTLLTTPPASAAATCASPVFKRQFFANTSFSGTPKKTDCDSAISENGGSVWQYEKRSR